MADRHDNESMRELYFDHATDDHGGFFKGMAMDFIDELPEIQKPMKILLFFNSRLKQRAG